MPRTIIGLDISEDAVSAVQVKSLMQGYQITGCATVPITGAGGISVALRSVCEDIDSRGSVCNSVVEDRHVSFRNLSMPFTDLRKIRQTIGFELETQVATPVDTQLIDFIDVDRTGSQTSLIAASVSRDYIRQHLANFEPFNMEPELLDIRNVSLANHLLMQESSPGNGILLDLGSKTCTLILFQDKKIVLIRQLPFNGKGLSEVTSLVARRETACLTDPEQYESGLAALGRSVNLTLRGFQVESGLRLEPEMVFVTGAGGVIPATAEIIERELGLATSNLNLLEKTGNIQLSRHLEKLYNPALMDNGLALALRETRKTKGFNFRREEFQVKTQFVKLRKELTHASVYLGIILLLLAVGFGVDYRDLKQKNERLDSQIRDLFSQTFPEVRNIVEPVHQMRTKISELKDASGSSQGMKMETTVLMLLNDISAKISQDLEIKVDRMVIDQDGVQIRGTTDTFNTVDSIKKGLESSSMYREVVIASANLDKSGKGVRFEIKMDLVL